MEVDRLMSGIRDWQQFVEENKLVVGDRKKARENAAIFRDAAGGV